MSVNTPRGVIPSLGIVVDDCRAGNYSLVNRLLRGVFHLRPSTPRYTETWDVIPVFRKLRTMHPLQSHTERAGSEI